MIYRSITLVTLSSAPRQVNSTPPLLSGPLSSARPSWMPTSKAHVYMLRGTTTRSNTAAPESFAISLPALPETTGRGSVDLDDDDGRTAGIYVYMVG